MLASFNKMQDEDECPICFSNLHGTLATIGCCKKTLHIECLIKCMEMKLTCPFCRTEHQNLHTIHERERIIVMQDKSRTVFRDCLLFTCATSIVGLSFFSYYF